MKQERTARGRRYYCPICGSEVAVLASRIGAFKPRCCNVDMIGRPERLIFYVCPVCGAEIAALKPGQVEFHPRCCNTDMLTAA